MMEGSAHAGKHARTLAPRPTSTGSRGQSNDILPQLEPVYAIGFTLAAAQGLGHRPPCGRRPRLPHDPPPLRGTGRLRGLAAPARAIGANPLPGRADEGAPAQ